MENIFKITIADKNIIAVFMSISLFLNIFSCFPCPNINTYSIQTKSQVIQLKSHLCRVYSAINVPIKLANKILRYAVETEDVSKNIICNGGFGKYIIKTDTTEKTQQKIVVLEISLNFLNSFKSKIFKNYPNYKHRYNYNNLMLFKVFKSQFIIKPILFFLTIVSLLPRGIPIFIKIISKNIFITQLYFYKAGFFMFTII
ncbi:MAG: hypothetical protein LBD57_01840 [Endomicrobium sp.]|jgi:hypothetical protein|uniref:hypothetical protein n=1 Tax=Candidatus Endomicrobiellum cubanum TaxID=3242325 RepID=UPI00283A8AB9|nr:hypothetical protein [Endomicrobium sp.]